MSYDQISPELVLVCPDLRARAIAALPEQPWLATRPSPSHTPTRGACPATVDRPEQTRRGGAALARGAVVYVLARAAEPLAIVTGMSLLVLVLAVIASAVRG